MTVTSACMIVALPTHVFTLLAPGTYSPEKLVLDHSPAYTFGTKSQVVKVNETPAPGQYRPEKVVLDHKPAFSFGIKHSQHRHLVITGRDQY